jgi:hypothetical protein
MDAGVLQAGKVPLAPGGLLQTGCSSCGSGMSMGSLGAGCGEGCYPGRTNECCYNSDSFLGRLFGGFYECICCPDPCYEPKWLPVADSAFFVDAARPVTQMRLRWDEAWDMRDPDRAEFFYARQGLRGPHNLVRTLDYRDLNMYMEAAAGKAGLFVETSYIAIDPTPDPLLPGASNKSGFNDMTAGTKAMLLDCELTQVTFQFKTYIPTGNFTSGLGTGHVSLEPSFLFNLRISPTTYVQGQLAYWIAIGGDNLYQGNVFHCHGSLNHVLCKLTSNVELVGTFEANEWSVMNGAFSSPNLVSNGQPVPIHAVTTMFSMGPGVRLFVCDKIDIGVGSAFATTTDHWAEGIIRTEFRWRF